MFRRINVKNEGIVIERGDFISYKSVPCWLESGHPLRRYACAVCGTLIGGNAMRVVIIVPMVQCTCQSTGLHPVAYLVCASHAQPDTLEIANAAADGIIPFPGQAC